MTVPAADRNLMWELIMKIIGLGPRMSVKGTVLLLLAGAAFIWSKSNLWIPLCSVGAFFWYVDLKFGETDPKNISGLPPELKGQTPVFGVLGNYDVDDAPSFGLFINLRNLSVFVDIREDQLKVQREIHAKYLHNNQDELGRNLSKFIASHPEFAARSVSYIGLHSKEITRGDVFWGPDGHTELRGTTFIL